MASIEREEAALDALIASFHVLDSAEMELPPMMDDPGILSAEDHAALAALGGDLVDRLIRTRVADA